MPKSLVNLTCSGYLNFGEEGTYNPPDTNTAKGINEYISTSVIDSVKRSWLTHSSSISLGKFTKTKDEFSKLTSGAYGVVTHSAMSDNHDEISPLIQLMDYWHSLDPNGYNSKTVSEIIEGKLIPEKSITINENSNTNPQGTNPLCADNICDAYERQNPQVCPQDCD